MLQTPPSFVALNTRQEHPDPHAFMFRGDELLVREADLALPDVAACASLISNDRHIHPVGMWNDRYCHTAWIDRDTAPPAGFTFRKLRSLLGGIDEALFSVAGRAFQIAEWARTHRYCGVCATPMRFAQNERCATCPACGMTAYPRISPAMMVLIRRDDAILLARHTNSPTNRFTALAGFLEAGESVEEAVHREVFEEVGLRIHDLKYFGSQSWPFPHSLMVAFTAEYLDGDIKLDPDEIAEAHWFGPGDPLPEIAPGVSIASALINAHLPAGRS